MTFSHFTFSQPGAQKIQAQSVTHPLTHSLTHWLTLFGLLIIVQNCELGDASAFENFHMISNTVKVRKLAELSTFS